MRVAWLVAALLAVLPIQAPAQTIRVVLNQDPDILDPTLSTSAFATHVYAAMCDKLFDIDAQLNIVPQLATAYRYEDPTHLVITLRPNVTFQDGEKFDAEAARFSLNRHLTMNASRRALALAAVQSVEVVDPLTVRLVLKGPSAPLVAQLTATPGIMVSPKAAEAAGDKFGLAPVCAGPYAFVSRTAQDRIVLRRFPGYWNAGAYNFDNVMFPVMTDSRARLSNLQTGNIDLVGFVPPSDLPAIRKDERLKIMSGLSMGYTAIIFNLNNGAGAQSAIGQNALLRQAFDAALDRKALADVAFDGMFSPAIQPNFEGSPYYVPRLASPPRDLARAKALIAKSGVALPVPVELTVVNNPWASQAAEIVQSMVNEAGFDLKIKLMEYTTSLQASGAGNFQAFQIDGGYNLDPDGNAWPFLHSKGLRNISKYSNPAMDKLLDDARLITDIAQRRELYGQAIDIQRQDVPLAYLFVNANIMAMRRNLTGLTMVPDAIMRLAGVRLTN